MIAGDFRPLTWFFRLFATEFRLMRCHFRLFARQWRLIGGQCCLILTSFCLT